jgi:hypothetical protein
VRNGTEAEPTVSVALELVPADEDGRTDSGESASDAAADGDGGR